MEGPVRNKTIKGKVPFSKYGQYFRLVEEEDYEFIFLLRSDKERGRHLSKIKENPESQRLWIGEYKVRERSGDEFYFISLDPVNGKRLGVFRLYDFKDNSFCTGSWLYKPGLRYEPILGNITGKEIGFDLLRFDTCRFDVRKDNVTIFSYHRLFNPLLIADDDLNIYFELSKADFEKTKIKILKLFGYPSHKNL